MVKYIIFLFFIFFIQNVFSQDGVSDDKVEMVFYHWGDLKRLPVLGKAVNSSNNQLKRDENYGVDGFGRPLIPVELDDFKCGPVPGCAVENSFPELRKLNLRPIFSWTNPVTSYGYNRFELYGKALFKLKVKSPKVVTIHSDRESSFSPAEEPDLFKECNVIHHTYDYGIKFEEYLVLGNAEIEVVADPFVVWEIISKEVIYLQKFLSENKENKEAFAYTLDEHFRKKGQDYKDHLFNVESLPETINFLSSQENHHQRILHTPLNLYLRKENIISGIKVIKKFIPHSSSEMEQLIERTYEIKSHPLNEVTSRFLFNESDSLYWKIAYFLNSDRKISLSEYKKIFDIISSSTKEVFDLLVPYTQLIKNKSLTQSEINSLLIYEAKRIAVDPQREIYVWSIFDLFPSDQVGTENKIIAYLAEIEELEQHIFFMNFFFRNLIVSSHVNILQAEYLILKSKFPDKAKEILHATIEKLFPNNLIHTFGLLMFTSLENKRNGISDSSIIIISDILDYLKGSSDSEKLKLSIMFSRLLNILQSSSSLDPNACNIFLEALYS
ncbi:MAG: hypothetical protein QE271_02320 [Bacteriovoracaceae bacterium]|nr:hypothetical protein [Bacteriovoracaceae bacterium]